MAKKAVLALIAIAIFTSLLVSGARALETSTRFCQVCHEMADSHTGWIQSQARVYHKDCIQCHAGPGLKGVILGELEGLREVAVHLSGQWNNPIRANVPDDFCTQFHGPEDYEEGHRSEPVAGKTCGVCHNHRPGANFIRGDGEGK